MLGSMICEQSARWIFFVKHNYEDRSPSYFLLAIIFCSNSPSLVDQNRVPLKYKLCFLAKRLRIHWNSWKAGVPAHVLRAMTDLLPWHLGFACLHSCFHSKASFPLLFATIILLAMSPALLRLCMCYIIYKLIFTYVCIYMNENEKW